MSPEYGGVDFIFEYFFDGIHLVCNRETVVRLVTFFNDVGDALVKRYCVRTCTRMTFMTASTAARPRHRLPRRSSPAVLRTGSSVCRSQCQKPPADPSGATLSYRYR
jgi:hypothetical protein